ncbi:MULTISPECIES: hypothetical protein [unclassified Yoonia]|uniref:hypothetical protein n=1 Tax=unclassified Yoonia TaxID=2629118 RepID=UPI002B000D0A|nr:MULTISPECIES: hypothetical protein [unclassified Yoonia]
MTNPPDDMLADLFAQARSVTHEPDDALIARVLADAARPALPVRAKLSLLDQLRGMIGGWPAFGSLAAATIAGVWIGIAPPPLVEDYALSLLGETVSVGLFADDFVSETGEPADG